MLDVYAMVIDDPKNFDLLSQDLKKRVLKAAVNTVNIQAALTRKNAVQNQKDLFHTRNTFTARQTQFTKCSNSVTELSQVESVVGATEKAAYMEVQEFGGFHTPHKGSLLSIPTDASREGGSFGGKVDKRYQKSGLKRYKVKGKYKKNISSPRARSVARAYIAAKEGLTVHYGKDVFSVINFSKDSGKNGKIHFEKKLVRNVELAKTYTPARPWLEPASQKPAEDCQKIFNQQMDKADKA